MPPLVDDTEKAKAKWNAARNLRPKDNNPAPSGGLVAALDQFTESYVHAASAMDRVKYRGTLRSRTCRDLPYYVL